MFCQPVDLGVGVDLASCQLGDSVVEYVIVGTLYPSLAGCSTGCLPLSMVFDWSRWLEAPASSSEAMSVTEVADRGGTDQVVTGTTVSGAEVMGILSLKSCVPCSAASSDKERVRKVTCLLVSAYPCSADSSQAGSNRLAYTSPRVVVVP